MKKILIRFNYLFIFFLFSISITNDNLALENCVKFDVEVDRKVYFEGENLYLKFNIEIDEGFHIYSVHPEKSLNNGLHLINNFLKINA